MSRTMALIGCPTINNLDPSYITVQTQTTR